MMRRAMRWKVGTALMGVTSIFFVCLYLNVSPSIISTFIINPPSLSKAIFIPQLNNRRHLPTPTVSILFPDWEVIVVVASSQDTPHLAGNLTCLFPINHSSPASLAGTLSFHRPAFRCLLPPRLRRTPLPQPALAVSSDIISPASSPELLRWNYLAYEAVTTENFVVLFVKGINKRQTVNRPVTDFECDFYGFKTAVVTAVQEIFRCQLPNIMYFSRKIEIKTNNKTKIKISLGIKSPNGAETVTVPSVAYYSPEEATSATSKQTTAQSVQKSYYSLEEATSATSEQTVAHRSVQKSLICACTMVYNVAKFLKEWVMYHSAIGVDTFILYNNDSDDELGKVVNELISGGYDVRLVFWIWPKTQEAGFSHCAVVYNATCTWMMYVDVDEFVYSPKWVEARPSKEMLRSMVDVGSGIGQVMIGCYEFGPSNQREHPREGVTQGYNCRRREMNRHKSIVLLDAVDDSLLNVIHHFHLKPGYRSMRVGIEEGIVNHYKYQAWSEFKTKYRRRVSAYVIDWTQAVNLASHDRAPGLGVVPTEPDGWPQRFCEVYDNTLRDLTKSWFGHQSLLEHYMAWQR